MSEHPRSIGCGLQIIMAGLAALIVWAILRAGEPVPVSILPPVLAQPTWVIILPTAVPSPTSPPPTPTAIVPTRVPTAAPVYCPPPSSGECVWPPSTPTPRPPLPPCDRATPVPGNRCYWRA